MTGKKSRWSEKHQLFFDKILAKNDSTQSSLVEELKDLSGYEKGAVYKRLKGVTLLKIDKLLKLSAHFNVSLDSLQEDAGFLNFKYDLINKQISGTDDLFGYILVVFDSIRNTPNNKLIYHSRNLPITHYFNYPILFQLKMLVWHHTSAPTKRLLNVKNILPRSNLCSINGN